MDGRALLERQLATVERQIADAEKHAVAQRDIITRLEAARLRSSETIKLARDLLLQIEVTLRAHSAERKRLETQLRRLSAR